MGYKWKFKQSLNFRILKHQSILDLGAVFRQLIFPFVLHEEVEAPMGRPLKRVPHGRCCLFSCGFLPPWILCLYSPIQVSPAAPEPVLLPEAPHSPRNSGVES